MKETFDELSKKLDNEIRLKENAERLDARNRSEAKFSGVLGAVIGIVFIGGPGGFVAFTIYLFVILIFGKEPPNITGVVSQLFIIIGASIGGYVGYVHAYRLKRRP